MVIRLSSIQLKASFQRKIDITLMTPTLREGFFDPLRCNWRSAFRLRRYLWIFSLIATTIYLWFLI